MAVHCVEASCRRPEQARGHSRSVRPHLHANQQRSYASLRKSDGECHDHPPMISRRVR